MSKTSSDSAQGESSVSESSRGSTPIALIGLLLLVVLIATNMKC